MFRLHDETILSPTKSHGSALSVHSLVSDKYVCNHRVARSRVSGGQVSSSQNCTLVMSILCTQFCCDIETRMTMNVPLMMAFHFLTSLPCLFCIWQSDCQNASDSLENQLICIPSLVKIFLNIPTENMIIGH